MKNILANNIVENVRRQPFNQASLEHIQEAYKEPLTDILKCLTSEAAGVHVLYGCVDADPDATDWDISVGSLFYNGEVFRVPAFVGSHGSNVPVLSIVTSYKTGDPVKFSDNNDFNVHEIRTMVWTMAASGSGIADFSALKPIHINKDTIQFVIDGGGAPITTGQKGHLVIPFNCVVTGWTILANASGSIVLDLWKDTYANFPPDVADTITGTEKPTLSGAAKNQDNALSTWTTTFKKGEIIAYNVDSITTVQRVTLSLDVIK